MKSPLLKTIIFAASVAAIAGCNKPVDNAANAPTFTKDPGAVARDQASGASQSPGESLMPAANVAAPK